MSGALEQCSAALLVRGPGADAADLTAATGLPFRQVRRSGQPSPIGPPVAREDSCSYRPDVRPEAPLEELLRALVADLRDRLTSVRTSAPDARLSIWCSYQSELAQMHVSLSPSVLDGLARLGLPLEISVFSWGLAE